MNNLKNLYQSRLSHCLCWSLTCLPLATQAADFVQIKPHPIDAIVQQNMTQKSVVPPLKKTSKIDQMRIMHIDIDYVYDKNKEQQQENQKTGLRLTESGMSSRQWVLCLRIPLRA